MKTTRREFLKSSALATGGIALSLVAGDLAACELPENVDPSVRATRIAIAYEAMISGMIVNRGLLPQVALKTGGTDVMNEVAIELWMGESPVATGRLRSLMGIGGDTVADMMKALQLDVGFVHQYMDVGYSVTDDAYGEFWLNHCGALLDAEPQGEEQVYGMCHTIEDPTFDATAFATNPKARIRPIHRPPRDPADRVPHCHWTIEIDPANEPVGPSEITQQVAALPLAQVPNPPPASPSSDGMTDYSGAFVPGFSLADLSTDTLRAVQEEFTVQVNLLAAAAELSLLTRFDEAETRRMVGRAWEGSSWISSERIKGAIGLPAFSGVAGIAAVLAEHPFIPPGFNRNMIIESNYMLRLVLTPKIPGLIDPDHPGIPGLIARGEKSGWKAMAQGVDPRSRLVDLDIQNDQIDVLFIVMPLGVPVTRPLSTLYMDGLATNWVFTIDES